MNVSKDAFQKELAQLKISIDTSHSSYAYQNNDDAENYRPKHYDNYSKPTGELFLFDPNTLDENGWKRLGVRDKTVNTIRNFISKGYRFRQPDDIRKIYGLRSQEADQLIPFVRILEKEGISKKIVQTRAYSAINHERDENTRTRIIDINLADTSAFISLPGIGTKLATRIINFRQKLGGFSSVNQLGETYGIADSTFQQIKGRLQCNNPDVKKLNINTADAHELRTHPYIRWNIANAIVNYRNQHGAYKSVDELHKIEIIDENTYTKMAPYIAL
ncbi:hypothetical protein SAE01_31160 [Segetibacter aerophilus]|uniref:Competence protein ComEA n=2 Tax=Segetibacter aerophilus TaxID=670293 RepID=A0A512BF75_9BACT|nr:hypothetical protein SAE01_31160 [Segetibacter aerophilus]